MPEENEEPEVLTYEVVEIITTAKHKIVTFAMEQSSFIGEAIGGIILDIEEEGGVPMKFNKVLEDTPIYMKRRCTLILDIDVSE